MWEVKILKAAIDQKDGAAVRGTLPRVVETLHSVAEFLPDELPKIARMLALGGFHGEAQRLVDDLHHLNDSPSLPERERTAPWQFVRLRADLGDFSGAIEEASALGPIAVEREGAAGQGVRQLVAGPKAQALIGIAEDMAEKGDIGAALQAEAKLEAESGGVRWFCDAALAMIVTAQTRRGDRMGALSTMLRITPERWWMSLLSPLAVAPKAD